MQLLIKWRQIKGKPRKNLTSLSYVLLKRQ